MQYERLQKICDEAIRDLLETKDLDDIEEILHVSLSTRILEMDPSESPQEVRDFFTEWLVLEDAAEGSNEEAHGESENEQERVRRHVDGHKKTIGMYQALQEFIIHRSPKSLSPTIFFFMLLVYDHVILGMSLCMHRELFGAELPEEHDHQHDGDESGEEDENEEEDDEEIT